MLAAPELYILRHGETTWNAENRMQGALDSPLTAKGQRQADDQGRILRGCDLTGFTFLSSPQGRAFHTAGIALAGIADMIRTDDRLREIGVGDWSGKLRSELPTPDSGDLIDQYEIAPNGEGFVRLAARCRDFISDLSGPTVIVTHGITSRMLRSLIIGDSALSVATVHGGQGCVYHLKNGTQNLLE